MAALAALILGALALTATEHTTPLTLPRAKAIQVALHSRFGHTALRHADWTSVTVTAVDSRLDRVSFFAGSRVLAQVAVNHTGGVVQASDFRHMTVPYGDWIAYEPALLIALAGLFVLMAAVAPYRRMRNLDVLVALTLVAPIVLLQHRYIDGSVLSALPGLVYFMVRCAIRALGPGVGARESVPLIDVITASWDPGRRIRLLRLLLVGLALAFVMITVSSSDAVDVVYAVMEGATKLLGGILPYGHMPGDVIHGDTYPLLSYALYVPLAWLAPVRSAWGSVDLALGATVAAALLVGWTLFRAIAGSKPPRPDRRPLEREAAGLRAALTWLAFPPVLVIASSGTSDVVLAAMLAVALVLWRRPALCIGCLAVAAWFKLAPIALIPLRLATLRGRRLAWALAAIALVTAPMLALLLALGGLNGPMAMIHAISFQFSRGSPQSVWSALGIQGLQPLGEAGVLALVCGAAVRLRAQPEWAEDRVRMAALSAAVLIGLELAANYWAFLYLIWVMPLLGLSLLGDPAAEPAMALADVRSASGRELLPAPVWA